MRASQALLLVVNNTPGAAGILTGKFFEYLGSRRPILCVGPKQGALRDLLAPEQAHHYIAYHAVEECIDALVTLESDHDSLHTLLTLSPLFSRKALAAQCRDITCSKSNNELAA